MPVVGFGLVVSSQSRRSVQARLTSRKVQGVVDAVSFVEPSERTFRIERGYLVGSISRTGTFELETLSTPIRYPGKVEEPTIPQIDGLRAVSQSVLRATLREVAEFSPADPTGRHKYSPVDILEVRDD